MKKLRRPRRHYMLGTIECVGMDAAGHYNGARNYIEINGDGNAIELRDMKKLAKWLLANIAFIEQEKKNAKRT